MLKLLAASVVVLGAATTAFAQTSMAPANGAMSGTMMKDDMVTVVRISEANKPSDSNSPQVPAAYRNASSDTMMKAQEMVKADSKLMMALEKQSVQMQNVVGVETAANGGKVVYVK